MRSPNEIWSAALGELQLQVSKPNFDTWLKDTKGIGLQDGVFTVAVPNAFVAEWLRSRLRSIIVKTLAGIIGESVNVQFVVHASEPRHEDPVAASTDGGVSVRMPPVAPPAPRLNPRYTLDTFVVGESNRLAFMTALDIVEAPSPNYNPLFIYGGTGLGKTHLLQGIAHAATNKHLNVVYLTAERFLTEYVAAGKFRKYDEFRGRFQGLDVFILDDVQFLKGREQTQECLLHIFIDLYNANCRIALAGDRPPKHMPGLDSRLQSRFSWGLVTGVVSPDRETRFAILQSKAAEKGISVPSDCLRTLAEAAQGNVRELEGILNHAIARSRIKGSSPDPDIVTQVLHEQTHDGKVFLEPQPVSDRLVLETVAACMGLSVGALTGAKRDRTTTLARHIAMYLMQRLGQHGLNEIGRALGDRDHSTVIHGIRRIENDLSKNAELSVRVKQIEERIRATSSPAGFPPPVGS